MKFDGQKVMLFKVLKCACGSVERVRVSSEEFGKIQIRNMHFDDRNTVVLHLTHCVSCCTLTSKGNICPPSFLSS